jgi:hypothetical protein
VNIKQLVKTKTFWAGVALVVSGVGAAVTGEQSVMESIQAVALGFMGIFGRQAIGKVDGSQDKTLPAGGVK